MLQNISFVVSALIRFDNIINFNGSPRHMCSMHGLVPEPFVRAPAYIHQKSLEMGWWSIVTAFVVVNQTISRWKRVRHLHPNPN